MAMINNSEEIVSGIYSIENSINKKRYIGSTNNFNRRKNNHYLDLRKNNHHSIILQNAYNKYGENNFIFSILLRCPEEELLQIEQYYLDFYKPEYNVSKIAGRSSFERTEEWKLKIGKANSGRVFTDKQRMNMKQYGWNKKPVYKICPFTFDIIDEYESGYEAARKNNSTKSSILACTGNKVVLHNNFHYCKKEDYNRELIIQKITNRYGHNKI